MRQALHHAGSYDHFLNFQIYLIILLQIVLCVFCSVAAYIWRERTGLDRAYLGLSAYVEGNYENGLAYTLILFITFWILYSYLVPISLFVSLEIVKFWQVDGPLKVTYPLFISELLLPAHFCRHMVQGT